MALLHIAAIMLPTMLICAWLLRLAGLGAPVSSPRPQPRKRPIDQGPETRLAEMPPRKMHRSNGHRL